jgi:hypothetical protein
LVSFSIGPTLHLRRRCRTHFAVHILDYTMLHADCDDLDDLDNLDSRIEHPDSTRRQRKEVVVGCIHYHHHIVDSHASSSHFFSLPYVHDHVQNQTGSDDDHLLEFRRNVAQKDDELSQRLSRQLQKVAMVFLVSQVYRRIFPICQRVGILSVERVWR